MNRFDLEFLNFLAQQQNPRPFLIPYLTHLSHPPWGALDEPGFSVAFFKIKKLLAGEDDLGLLFERFLLAWLLADKAHGPPWAASFLKKHLDLNRHFPDVAWETILGGTWTDAPVLMVAGGKGEIHHFMAGRFQGENKKDLLPQWAIPLLDNESLTTLHHAAEAAAAIHPLKKGTRLYIFPLAAANARFQITGSSLGLPAAIGFLKVLTGEKIAPKLLATGSVDPKGCVGKIEGLREKRLCASGEDRFSLLLFPEENAPISANDAVETLPVATLEEAWMFARWHVPGNGKRLVALSAMLSDPHAFLDHMKSVDSSWVKYQAVRGKFSGILEQIAASAELFAPFVSHLNAKIANWQLKDAGIYCDFISEYLFERAAAGAPLSAFGYACATLALANHTGDVMAGRAAANRANRLFPRARSADVNLCADFFNYRLVSLHNEYRFDCAFPEDLRQLLAMLESRYQCQCEVGCPTDTVLARLYGTVAQNYGFCGPGHLANTEKYAHLSMTAFGGGKVPEYCRDVLRQYAYLIYALLDAQDHLRARDSLFAFLGAADWQQVHKLRDENRLNIWQHAALSRFLADVADHQPAAAYLDWCSQGRKLFTNPDHPRQLWTFNLGRIALHLNRPDPAVRWFKKSLKLCLHNQRRATIYVMALLPFSALWHMGVTDAYGSNSAINKVIETALKLNASHFESLAGAGMEAALEQIWQCPQRLFPFSYR
ncbi:MAG: hypothetical protein Q8P24_10350 [Desulfobacterales bacterium]|nr:hypothetical protein [Desulfobacterales bacterium]